MEFKKINIGIRPNDGTGDCLRDGGDKINKNFEAIDENINALYIRLNRMNTEREITREDAGTRGDLYLGNDYAYFCVESGEAGQATWKKVPLTLLT